MNVFEEHCQILGLHMRDMVTDIEGMVDSVCFDAYGCVQATLRRKVNEKGIVPDPAWFDVKRLQRTDTTRVMPVPEFPAVGKEQGAADKPMR
jgi:hypothetical protein